MKKKRAWMFIPGILLPYAAASAMMTIIFSAKVPLFGLVMTNVFGGNALYLLAALGVFVLFASVLFVCGIIPYFRSDALCLAKGALIAKLLLIPAYVFNFVFGAAMTLSLLSLPFALVLLALGYLTLLMTGAMNLAAMLDAVRQGQFTKKEVLWMMIAQVFFCADVIASIVFFRKLGKRISR